MNLEWWHWIVLGLGLVVAELAVPAFFIIWFGLGALLVGLVLLVAPLGATAQIGLWIVASVAMVGLWFRVFNSGEYLRSRTQVGQSDGDTIGEIGLMTKPAEPFARGKVRFQKPVLLPASVTLLASEAAPSGQFSLRGADDLPHLAGRWAPLAD